MESIRAKDKLFLAVIAPAALVAAYVFFWRADAVRRIAELEREDAALVTVGDYPADRASAERRLAAATAELEAERRIPAPAVRVKAKADDSLASRERAALEVFRLAGLIVGRSENADDGVSSARDVLSRTGFRPSPVCRRYAVAGNYPQVCAALRTFAEREMAVIPDRIEMAKPGHWTIALWL